MPEEPEKSGAEPNLELPSLFGRGRKKKRQAEEPTEDTAETEETEEIADEPEAPTGEPAPAGPMPVEGSTRRLPPTPPPPSRDTEETAPIQATTAPPVEPPVEPVPEPVPVEPTPPPPAPEPVPEPTPVEPPPPTPAPAPVEPTPEPQPAPVEETAVLPGPVPLDEPVGAPLFADEVPAEPPAPKAPKPPKERKERTPITLPRINPRIAALLTGLVVGFVGVLLSFAASQGCESVRGVGSCGGIGLFALLAVLVVEVLIGAALLKAFGVVDPTSTSFLGVGLVAVLALLFFLSALDSVWMLLVLPLLTAITFLLSWWVTETFVEQGAGDDLHR